jgi:hypothetical protein
MLARAWAFIAKRFNALVAILVLIFGAGIAYTYQKRRTATVKDLLEIEKAQDELVRLRMEREAYARLGEAKRGEVNLIDLQIDARKKRIVAIHEEVAGLDPAQVAEAFARLGY